MEALLVTQAIKALLAELVNQVIQVQTVTVVLVVLVVQEEMLVIKEPQVNQETLAILATME